MNTAQKSDSTTGVTGVTDVGALLRLSTTMSNTKNVYFVYLKADEDQEEGKVAIRYTYPYYEPPEIAWLGDLFVAESPGKAKVSFLKHFNDVAWIEDWKNIRVRKVGIVTGMVEETKGVYNYGNPQFDQFWGKIHEILDHDGKKCDCPMDEE